MIFIKDCRNELQPCKRLIEAPQYQSKTSELLYTVYAQGYDDVRMIPLFTFFTRIEMESKYAELFKEYMEQIEKKYKE